MAREFLTRAANWLGPVKSEYRAAGIPPLQRSLLEMVKRETEMLASLNDPNGIYALCDCEVE
jgi:hypothetical protein